VLGKLMLSENQEQNNHNSERYVQHTLFYEVNASITDSRNCKAYRASIYKTAQDCNAFYCEGQKLNSIYYDGDSKDLTIRLLFKTESDAFNFQNKLSNFMFDHPTLGVKINVEKDINIVALNNYPERVFYIDYNTDATDSPPFFTLADIKSSLSESLLSDFANPESAMQSLEDVSLYPNLKLYWCHLISRKQKQHSNNKNNAIFGSWIFHQYFDALNSVNDYPELAVKFESIGETTIITTAEGQNKSKTKVNVSIEFIDEKVASFMSIYFKKGTITVDTLHFQSFLYADNGEEMKYFLEKKYEETKALWEKFLNS
jgi:hypothetical protein